MLNNLANKKILLGSKSPRRQELLRGLGISFEVVSIDCDETYPSELKKEAITNFISEAKAKAYPNLQKNEVLITADTLVGLDELILGKPQDEQAAFDMLQSLAGKAHQVYTSVSLRTTEKLVTFSDRTNVFFDEMSEEEINFYVKNFHPMDKAGAYGIQDWLGYTKVSKIKGCYYNVMGLPLQKLYRTLQKL